MKALAFSGGKDSLACFYLLREELDCAIYVDTGFSYPETRRLVNMIAEMLAVHVVLSDRKAQNAHFGLPSDVVPIDWTTTGQAMSCEKPFTIQPYTQCCYDNIARPLLDKAKSLGVTELVYGQREDESHRSISKDGDLIEGIIRRQPIEKWDKTQVLEYLKTKMDVPAHFTIEHSSLDCYDCTAFAKESRDRIEWMRLRYPFQYAAYKTRADNLKNCMRKTMEIYNG